MKAIVTGGAGFIGSHLVDNLLGEGVSVTVLDNLSTGRPENLEHIKDQIKLIECDISKAGIWEKEFDGANWVIHLAALADIVPSINDPEAYFHANVVGTLNVLQASKKYKIKRFIYSASSSCYGIPAAYPTPEDTPMEPQYPYALTKRLGEELVIHWAKLYNLPALSLRFFNVYGPRSRTSGTYGAVFGVFLAHKLAQEPMTIVGDGNQTRDFTYVTDIASALMAALLSSKSTEIYNVGSGATISVNRISELIGGEIVYIPKRPGEPDCTFADISKINEELNWEPTISIEHGVEMILENIHYWAKAPVWTPNEIKEATADWFKYLGKE